MKRAVLPLLLLLLVLPVGPAAAASGTPPPGAAVPAVQTAPAGTVLLVFGHDFLYGSYTDLVTQFEQAGYDVVLASHTLEPLPAADTYGVRAEADLLLEEVQVAAYEAVVFSSDRSISFGYRRRETSRIVQEALEQGKVLGALGNAPLLLGYAGAVEGVQVTGGFPRICNDLERDYGAICTRTPIAQDGLIVTAQDGSVAIPLAQAIVQTLRAQAEGQLDPFDLISQNSLFRSLEDLTAIQPYSGWRNAATGGEAQALDYVAARMGEMAYLQEAGLELERESFRVYNTTEIWETGLALSVGGRTVEVPAETPRGQYHSSVEMALRFDSDGSPNDTERNPVVVEGPVVPIRSYGDIQALAPEEVEGRIAFLDYAAIDRFALDANEETFPTAADLLALRPAGVVMVTQFSNELGESHGTFAGDSNAFVHLPVGPQTPAVPTLFVQLENLAAAGINDWDDLARVEAARLTWDADILAPAASGNLVARIPGVDPSQAVILGAHIDSPNCPGALDDGSGSAILLEIARVLNAARVQPAVDLYLAWFGSEEVGALGAAHFASQHQDLLDRTIAMLQIDMLSYPLDDLPADIRLTTWSYGRLGDGRLTWPDFLSQTVAARGVEAVPANSYEIQSDNEAFIGFDVPNANMCYEHPYMARFGAIHYATHVHSPYDTMGLARQMGEVFEQMCQVALTAALETGRQMPNLRVTPEPDRRALFVGSHTEDPQMTPVGLVDLGQTLAMAGFDVDLIPYGQAVTDSDLESADLVVALPVVDYPGQGGDPSLYDEAWTEAEIDALERYVARGGFLVLTNSAHRLGLVSRVRDYNEDWRDVNALAERFGIHYRFGTLYDRYVWVERGSHPLMERTSYIQTLPDNGIPFYMNAGEGVGERLVLGHSQDNRIVIGLVHYGGAGGEVLALADLGLLGSGQGTPSTLRLWQNLAQYIRQR